MDEALGFTPLHLAVLHGRHDEAAALLAAKAKVNAKTKAQAHSFRARTRILRPAGRTFFLDDPVDLGGDERAFDKGASPLHFAAALGHLRSVELLVAHKANISLLDGVKATPLHLAALGGHLDTVKLLIERGAKVELATTGTKSLRFYDVGMTPVLAALESGNDAVVRALVDAGANLKVHTKTGCSAIFFAARGGNVAALNLALDADVDPKQPGAYNNFPLVEAVAGGHLAMVERLLEVGAPPESNTGQSAPLLKATEDNRLDIRKALLDGGAKPLRDFGPHTHARNNDVTALSDYLKAGNDPNLLDGGTTPLMTAAAMGRVAAAKVLIDGGADVNRRSSQGTALHFALANQQAEIADLILDANADCSIADDNGNLALMSALMYKMPNRAARIARMVKLGADPHKRNRAGACPSELAKDMGDPGVVALLSDGRAPEPYVPFKTPERSAVLEEASANESWKKLHKKLWNELVPPRGQCDTIQGELVRCIGKLNDEAFRNGNINWSLDHRRMVDFIEKTLIDGTFSSAREQTLQALCERLRDPKDLDLSGDGCPHYVVCEAVVDWCLAHRKLIPRTLDPNLKR